MASKKRDVTVKALSSNLLQMKFMKKTVLGDPEKEDEDEYKDDPDHWVLDGEYSKRHKFELNIQPSHSMCEDLVFGRMSFKGFNPAIEKVMRAMNGEEEPEPEAAADDQQFAQEYAQVQNIGDKFKTKKERNRAELANPYKKGGTKKSERLKPRMR